MMKRSIIALLLALVVSSASAFVVQPPASAKRASSSSALQAHKFVEIATTATAIAMSTFPLAAIADDGNFEFGAVDAPIAIAWGVGAVAILTALLPLAMKDGEEAFEEMKKRDADTWDSENPSDALKKRRR